MDFKEHWKIEIKPIQFLMKYFCASLSPPQKRQVIFGLFFEIPVLI